MGTEQRLHCTSSTQTRSTSSRRVLGVACLATAAMLAGNRPALLVLVFLMGTQSALFGPLKLGWLPERHYPSDLVRANSWLDTGAFLANLGRTIAGGLLSSARTLVWAGGASIVTPETRIIGLGEFQNSLKRSEVAKR